MYVQYCVVRVKERYNIGDKIEMLSYEKIHYYANEFHKHVQILLFMYS